MPIGNSTWCSKLAAGVLLVTGAAVAWPFQSPATGPAAVSSQPPVFEKDVLPIWKANTCLVCHSPSLKTKDLDLSTYEGLQKGSESGPVVVPGKPDESRLYHVVHDGLMPPGGKIHLSATELGVIRSWIEGGAKAANGNAEDPAAATLTQHDIIPIMYLHCTECHGLRRQESGLDLRTRAGMLKGGKSGPVLIPGKPDQSLIVQKVRAGEMPPRKMLSEARVKPMSPAEVDKLAKWVAQGAPDVPAPPDLAGTPSDPQVSDKDRQFWAFQPPKAVEPPRVQHGNLVRNPIDAFVLAKLEQKGLSLSTEADKLTLIRRAYFDLTGLPPEPAEVKAFLTDSNPDAYNRLVDRLLASPRYGERWGRYWLDAAGYADSEGGKMTSDDPRPLAWRYRDYVIQSLNADKPYDQFLLEQIAGDELLDFKHAKVVTKEMMDNLIATGFLRMAQDSTNEPPVNFVDDRLDVMADEIDVFSSTVMGLTMKCAHCHSHKYDPIPHRDYYRMIAVFKGAYDEHDWISPLHFKDRDPGRLLPYIDPDSTPFELAQREREREEHNLAIEKQVKALKSALDEKAEPVKKKILDQRLDQLPKSIQGDLRAVLDTPPDKRSDLQKYLASKFETLLKVEPSDLKAADAGYRKDWEDSERQVRILESKVIPEPMIRALWDRGQPSPTYLLRRGNSAAFGPLVNPGPPSVLLDGIKAYEIQPPWPGAQSTGRRLALARWLIQPNHPLTARVMVNRMWAGHFGAGIVKSVGNFGRAGSGPSNQELLDWLAIDFVKQGWSMKAMHRLMMTSSAYRQSSKVPPELEKADPQNKMLSRMPLRRMEGEVLSDTMALVAGRLDESRFGPPDPVMVRDDGLVDPIQGPNGWRRSVYIQQRRSETPTILESFDFPQLSPACLERSRSNVAPQALNLLNDGMVRELAEHFAARVEKESGNDPRREIEEAYWIALSRPPNDQEVRVALDGLLSFRKIEEKAGVPAGQVDHKALAKLCHMVMNSAAFIYID